MGETIENRSRHSSDPLGRRKFPEENPADGLNPEVYMVYDEAELDLHDLFLARVRCLDERWRLRFLVVSPVQLRGNR
jgi:hypothetical protein